MFWGAVAIMVLFHVNGGACCGGHERDSLLQFKASVLVDPSYEVFKSWHGFNCCEWNGIQCHPHTHHVIRLDLHSSWDANFNHGMSLRNGTGDVISPFFNLQHLEHLDLSWNSFFGVEIPSGLSRLKSLRYLDLSWAGFSGDIPADMGNMSTLLYLDLSSQNNLRMVDMRMWRGNMRNLRELVLSGVEMSRVESNHDLDSALSTMYSLTRLVMSICELSGEIPPSLTTLANLTHLTLDNNEFNGAIPSALLSLPRLQLLDLSYNADLGGNLSSILPQHSASLRILNLSETSVGGSIPDSVANISSLTLLDLAFCYVESIPITMTNHTALKELYLIQNMLRGQIPPFGEISSPLGRHFPLAHIDLSHNQLDGPIPPILFTAFPNLQIVRLNDNQLTGSIPSPALKLRYLTEVSLDDNALTGQIPPSISLLVSLEKLYLSNNKLEGDIPLNISNLSKLNTLYLDSNLFSGVFSDSHLQNLGQLVDLDISDNLLTVKFSPTWIPKFSLQGLSLRSCNMEGGIPTFLITQYDVNYVDLSNNSLAGDIPQWIWGLNALADHNLDLNLSHNHFVGVLPYSLMGSNLHILDLHSNNLQGQLPLLPNALEVLDVSENQLSGSIPVEFGEYPNLKYLFLFQNHLNGTIPPSLLCTVPVVDLSNNKLTGNIPACFKNSSTVEVLNLENNNLEGKLPDKYANMPSLKTLKLGGNGLNSSIPASLVECKQLEILDLNNNNMGGFIPNWIGKLPSLKILILRSNRFEGEIPSEVTILPLLQILDLSSNRFSGVIPPNISSLQALRNTTVGAEVLGDGEIYRATIVNKGREMEFVRSLALVKCIDLSGNNLTGGIPQNIGLLQGLVILNISRNHILGEIPKSFGKLEDLESLDLSHNRLSENIPLDLQLLTFLSYLDLSHNNLSGRIPQGGQFETFDAPSFSNNSDLCGLQLNTTCCGIHQNKSCPATIPPGTNADKKDEEEEEDDVWWGVGLGMSYAVGFSTVIAVLCFTTTWSRKCFQVMDNIIICLFERFRI